MVALERVNEYSILPNEAPEFIEPRPDPSWPSEGKVEVKDLIIRYAVSTSTGTVLSLLEPPSDVLFLLAGPPRRTASAVVSGRSEYITASVAMTDF